MLENFYFSGLDFYFFEEWMWELVGVTWLEVGEIFANSGNFGCFRRIKSAGPGIWRGSKFFGCRAHFYWGPEKSFFFCQIFQKKKICLVPPCQFWPKKFPRFPKFCLVPPCCFFQFWTSFLIFKIRCNVAFVVFFFSFSFLSFFGRWSSHLDI